MSTAIATLPRAGGNGAALVVVMADFLMGLFAAKEKEAAPSVKAVPTATFSQPAENINVWQLYHLTAGSDSVSQKVTRRLQA